jgi:hypothetical protein
MEKVDIIYENDTLLNVTSYFNVDHELEWWMWMLMNILFYVLQTSFAIRWIFEVLAQMADYIGKLNWLFLIMHGINFLFSIF